MSVDMEHMVAADFCPRPVRYVDKLNLFSLYHGLFDQADAKPLIVVGPKGTGKSLSIAAFAHKMSVPLITFDCSEDIRRSQLIGQFVLRGASTPFVLGPLTTAFMVANEVGSCILNLEEVNALSPQCQKLLNSIADFRRRIEVPECKTVFELAPGKKLWLTGSMNTAVYAGVYNLNEDFKSRVRLLNVGYPSTEEEAAIVNEALSGVVSKLDPKDVKAVLLLAHETRQKALDYALSTRDVVAILEDIAAMGKNAAMRLVLGKFDGDDQTTVKQRISSIFSGVAF
jgi:nitric oxide reductase NorQ protein